MKKILIIISSDLYIRNYLTHENFKLIEENFDCNYLASDEVEIFRHTMLKKEKFHGFIKCKSKSDILQRILTDALLIAYRGRSSSFLLRIIMRFNLNFRNVLRKPLWKIPLRVLFRLYRASRIIPQRFFLSLFVKNKFIRNKLNDKINHNPILEDKIKNINPDLIIIPNSGFDKLFFQTLVAAKNNKVNLFTIIDNWDNLSTKSVLPSLPNYVGVWGEQTKKHAIEIQNFKSYQCKIIGSSRYEEYFKLRNESLKSNFDFEYILFLGTSWHWNEEEVLLYLDEMISSTKFKKKFKIVYRPHPWRQGQKIAPIKLKNIIYDPEMLKIINKEIHNQPDLNYYPSLIKNSLFVMGGPQTMMIETVIFNKVFLALTHDDKINYTNMKKVFSSYEHFRGVENIESIKFCYEIENIKEKIEKILAQKMPPIEKIDKQRNLILFNDENTYKQKLLATVNEILNSNTKIV